MSLMPTGTVTFVFTDIEGSTKLWEQHPKEMAEALQTHDAILSGLFAQSGGFVVKHRGEGDSFFVVFASAKAAIEAATSIQLKLTTEKWSTPEPIRVRMALHTGEAELRDGDYYGPTVNRCARLRATAHGGQILISAITAQAVSGALPDFIALLDLGKHLLKDMEKPEQVYQLVHPQLLKNFPPLKSQSIRKHNLPSLTTSFIGRKQECEEVSEHLRHTRILSILGPGGSGKTRLSLQIAAETIDQFTDGIWQVELAPLSDPQLVTTTVAATLSVKEQSDKTVLELLTESIGDKKILLLLDNCEHLVEAVASLTNELLKACPNLTMLATSREPLNLMGETQWRIPQLTVNEAVRLFVERASHANRSFTLTEQNKVAVMNICKRLDGIPLAIELGAARIKALSAEQIAQRLDDSFRLLTGGDRTKLPRQQTLRAIMDWSHDLLSGMEKALWRRLSVFAGNFSLEAAEEVCSSDGTTDAIDPFDILDLLTQLIDKSIVLAEEKDGVTRYRILETVRQYGAEKLAEASEQHSFQLKHFQYFTRFMEQSYKVLQSPHMQAEQVSLLAQELDNLRIAMDWGQQRSAGDIDLLDQTGRLLSSSLTFWNYRGLSQEGFERIERWLTIPATDQLILTRAKVLSTASFLSTFTTSVKGRSYAEESLKLASMAGDSLFMADAHTSLASSLYFENKIEEAFVELDHALVLYEQLNEQWKISQNFRFRVIGLLTLGRLEELKQISHEGLALLRAVGNIHDEASTIRILGFVAIMEQRYDEARDHFQRSVTVTSSLGDKQCTIEGIGGTALLAASLGQSELAARFGGAFTLLAKATGSKFSNLFNPKTIHTWNHLQTNYSQAWNDGAALGYDLVLDEIKQFLK